MGNETGWIKLHRQILNNPVFRDPIRFRAWIYLICRVNHKRERFLLHGNYIWIERGQTVTSLRQLSSIWECNVRTVKKILDQFQEEGMIKYEIPQGKYTLITLVKYDVYQCECNTECNTEYNSECNTEYIQTRMNKNDKNEKKLLSDPEEELFDKLWSLYPRKEGKASVSKKTKHEIYKIGYDRMAAAIAKYKQTIIGREMKYVKMGSSFFNTNYVDFLEEEKEVAPAPETENKIPKIFRRIVE